MRLSTGIEQLWLRALPMLTRDYLWVATDGLRFYGSREHYVMLYWLQRGKYERHTRTLFEQSLKPGMHVLDIGAHIGYFTLLAARRVGSTGRVYSFEPDPANYRFLCHNVTLNGMGDIVTAVPRAVADASGSRPFFADRKNSVISSLWSDGQSKTEVPVECTTVDDFVGSERIDVVKLDVEGGEVHALRGMHSTLSETERLILFVECNPVALTSAGVSVSELLDELRLLDFDVEVIEEKQRRVVPVTSDLLKPELVR
jgi:FkbM family methyltransferase